MTGEDLSDVMQRATRDVPVPTEQLVDRALVRAVALRRRRRLHAGLAAAALVVGFGGGAALAPSVLDLGDGSRIDPAGQGEGGGKGERPAQAEEGGPLVLPGSERAVVSVDQLRERLAQAMPAGVGIGQVAAADLTEDEPGQTIGREVSAVVDGQAVTFTVFPADGVRPGGAEPRAQSRIDCFASGLQGAGPGECTATDGGGWLYVDDASGLIIHRTFDGWRIEMASDDGRLRLPDGPSGPQTDEQGAPVAPEHEAPSSAESELNEVEELVLSDLWFQD